MTQAAAKSALYVQYASPGVYPPVERSAAILKRAGWQVRFLGVVPEGQAAALKDSPEIASDVEYMIHTPGGWRGLRSYLRFWVRAWTRARREKPDLVYCSDQLSYPAGLLIAMTTPAITLLHEHDTALGQGRFNRLLNRIRAQFARRADIRVNPQAERAQIMRDQTGCDEVLVAYNVPSLDELPSARAFADKPAGLTLWHHGSLNAKRLTLETVEALANLPKDVRLVIVGYETVNTKGYIDSVMARAHTHGVADRVDYLGALPREALYQKALTAHVGLTAFVNDFVEPMVGASNKPFDYMGCSLALLVNDTAEWRDFFAPHGVAGFCNSEDPADIARAVQTLYDDRDALAEMADHGRALIERAWHYETQFQPVLDRIHVLLSARKP